MGTIDALVTEILAGLGEPQEREILAVARRIWGSERPKSVESLLHMILAGKALALVDGLSCIEESFLTMIEFSYRLPASVVKAVDGFELSADHSAAHVASMVKPLVERGSFDACELFSAMITIAELDNLSPEELAAASYVGEALGLSPAVITMLVDWSRFERTGRLVGLTSVKLAATRHLVLNACVESTA